LIDVTNSRTRLLGSSDRNGATLLSAQGFDAPNVAGLVNHGLATLTWEQVKAGGKDVEVVG
jgi:hypothetical protein